MLQLDYITLFLKNYIIFLDFVVFYFTIEVDLKEFLGQKYHFHPKYIIFGIILVNQEPF